jgi:UDP-N-acetylmuramate dehydrogenase
VLALPAFDPSRDLMLGGGSNLLLVGDVPGTVYLNGIMGIEVVEENDDEVTIEAGAGEAWHDFVMWSLEQGYCGLENLSLIPGKVGAAPIQNIGAYGVELSSVLESVTAWDWQERRWRVFDIKACHLGYRDSRFKSEEPDRYLITSVRIRLRRAFNPVIAYAGLVEELGKIENTQLTARDVSQAVIAIRQRKLPDPAQIGNAGSFFKNPVLSESDAHTLLTQYPQAPNWPADGGMTKVSAAWMIEQCGLKGYRQGNAAVSDRHALVLVNAGDASGGEIWQLALHVRSEVERCFGVSLQAEPRIVHLT